MYSEHLAVLLVVAAAQMHSQGLAAQPAAQAVRGGVEKTKLVLKQDRSLVNARSLSNRIQREREVMRLAGMHKVQ